MAAQAARDSQLEQLLLRLALSLQCHLSSSEGLQVSPSEGDPSDIDDLEVRISCTPGMPGLSAFVPACLPGAIHRLPMRALPLRSHPHPSHERQRGMRSWEPKSEAIGAGDTTTNQAIYAFLNLADSRKQTGNEGGLPLHLGR